MDLNVLYNTPKHSTLTLIHDSDYLQIANDMINQLASIWSIMQNLNMLIGNCITLNKMADQVNELKILLKMQLAADNSVKFISLISIHMSWQEWEMARQTSNVELQCKEIFVECTKQWKLLSEAWLFLWVIHVGEPETGKPHM